MEVFEILQAISTLLFAITMFILNSFKNSLDVANKSIGELNSNISMLIANDTNKDKRLDMMTAEINNIRMNLHEVRNDFQKQMSKMEIKLATKEN